MIKRLFYLLSHPKSGWGPIRENKQGVFAFFLLLIPLFALAGWAYFQNKKGGDVEDFPLIVSAFVKAISGLSGLLFCVLILPKMAKAFASSFDRNSAFNLFAFAWFPVLVGDFLIFLSGGLDFFQIVYLYTIYLLWTGLETLAGTSGEKKLGFVFILLMFAFGSIYVVNRLLIQLAYSLGFLI